MSTDKSPSSAKANYVLALLVLVYMFNFIDRQILSVLLVPIKEDLGIQDDKTMGFLTGFVFAAFYTCAGIPIARWADSGSRKLIISVSLTIWSAMTAVSGLCANFVQLALARVGVGIGEAGGTPPAHSLISDYFPPNKRAGALAIYAMGAYFGILIGYPLAGYLNAEYGWRMAFVIVGLPGIPLALLVWLTIPEPARGLSETRSSDAENHTISEVIAYLWKLKSFRHLSFAGALYAFAGYGFITWIPAFLIRVHGMGTAEIGLWLGPIIGGGGAFGAWLSGQLCNRYGTKDPAWNMRIAAIGGLLLIPFMVLFLLWPYERPYLIYLPGIIFGSFYVAPTFAMAQGLAKLRMRALASAVVLFITNLIGLGLGPFIVGWLNDELAPRFGDEAVRYSLLIVGFCNIWAVAHSLMAAKTIKADLEFTAASGES